MTSSYGWTQAKVAVLWAILFSKDVVDRLQSSALQSNEH